MNLENELPNEILDSQSKDWEQWLGNWTWRAIHCLIDSPDFNPSPKWIASRLNISVDKAVEGLEGVVRIGCVKLVDGKYFCVEDWFQLSPVNLARNKLLAAHTRIVPQLISKLNDSDAFTSQMFLADKELVQKYGKRFMALFEEMHNEGKAKKSKDVVAAQISFVQLTGQGGIQ